MARREKRRDKYIAKQLLSTNIIHNRRRQKSAVLTCLLAVAHYPLCYAIGWYPVRSSNGLEKLVYCSSVAFMSLRGHVTRLQKQNVKSSYWARRTRLLHNNHVRTKCTYAASITSISPTTQQTMHPAVNHFGERKYRPHNQATVIRYRKIVQNERALTNTNHTFKRHEQKPPPT